MAKKKSDAATNAAAKKSGEQSAKPISKADVSQFLSGFGKKAPQTQVSNLDTLSNAFPEISDGHLWHACQIIQTWHTSIDSKELFVKAKAKSNSLAKTMAIKDHIRPILSKSVSSCASDELFAIQQVCWVADTDNISRVGVIMKVVPWEFQFICILNEKVGIDLEFLTFYDKRRIDSLMMVDVMMQQLLRNLFALHGMHLIDSFLVLSNQMLSELGRILRKSGHHSDAKLAGDVLHIRESLMLRTSHKLDIFQAVESLEAKAHFLCHLNTLTPLCALVEECDVEEEMVGHSKLVEIVSTLVHEDFPKIQARHSTPVSVPMTLKATLVKIVIFLGQYRRILVPLPNAHWLCAEILQFLHDGSRIDSFWEPRKNRSIKTGFSNMRMAEQNNDFADIQPMAPNTVAYEISDSVLRETDEKMRTILQKSMDRITAEAELYELGVNRYADPYSHTGGNLRRPPFDGTPGTNLLTARWEPPSTVDEINQTSLRGVERERQTGAPKASTSSHESGRNNSLDYDGWPASLGGMGSITEGAPNPALIHPNEELYEDVFHEDTEYHWGDDFGFSGRPTNNMGSAFHQQDDFIDYNDYLGEPPPPPPNEPPPDSSFFDNLSAERSRVLEAFGDSRSTRGTFQADERPDFGTDDEDDEEHNFRLTSQFDNLTLGNSKQEQDEDLHQEIDPMSDTKEFERGPPPPVPLRKYGKNQGANSFVDA